MHSSGIDRNDYSLYIVGCQLCKPEEKYTGLYIDKINIMCDK